jgi:hypothetical protein
MFGSAPGAFSNFVARAEDEPQLVKIVSDALGELDLELIRIHRVSLIDATATQPPGIAGAIERVLAEGNDWAYDTFYIYEEAGT